MGTAVERRSAGERYAALMAAVVRRLPFGLSRVVAPTFLGFALINSLTFGLDLALLTVAHGQLDWPLPLAITLAYGTALTLAYTLNRVLNFRSHAAVGPQFGVYVAVVATNYAVCVLGAGTGFTAAGLDYRLARVLAGLCEAAFMYVAMRRVVFRDSRDESRDESRDRRTPASTAAHPPLDRRSSASRSFDV